ncbi:penicillin acylase family protein [Thiorhodococcus fuscus]|uniref:Penicillin acylase family protein n=1 Tax=Thiorhodococcus fuscus TaxID=527200 RepID=A0ABW4YE71_9GAMM
MNRLESIPVNPFRRWGRLLGLVLILMLSVLALGAGWLYWQARRAEPTYAGQVVLDGLQGPVRVRFGPHAVPSIQARDMNDLMFAQGYVVASERMWQMDLMRRLSSGRLAEVFGPEVLPADRFFRTIGLERDAQRAFAALSPTDRDLLRAYASGVNAYLTEARGRLPLEYRLSGFEPIPWEPVDSLAIGGYLGWMLSFNAREELTFLRLADRVGPFLAPELFPTDEGIPAPEVAPELIEHLAEPGSQVGLASVARVFADAFQVASSYGLPVPGPASNAWVVTGSRTSNGGSMLANDPHLAVSMPGIWYELELRSPELHVAGACIPGIPLVLIGHNADLAWGFTSVMADTQDLFVERLTPDGTHLERSGGDPEPIETRVESIRVAGGEPVELRVRSSGHGVILNDILDASTASMGLGLPPATTSDLLSLRRTTDRPDLGFAALVGLAHARTLEEARRASRGFTRLVVNLMLAHRNGAIGWQIAGDLPRRGKGSGTFPVPGWLSDYDWRGLVPQSENPHVISPKGNALITANHRTVPVDSSVNVGHSWMAPYRAQRIAQRLDSSEPLTPAMMAEIQGDRVNLEARLVQQALRSLSDEIQAIDPAAWSIARIWLLDWDGDMDGANRSAALFAMLEPALYREIYGDELGDRLDDLMSMAMLSYGPLEETLRTGRSSFWDDLRTPVQESPAQIWARAIRSAMDALGSDDSGDGPKQLDQVRYLRFAHAFDAIPLLGSFFSVGPIGVGGARDTINATQTLPQRPERGLVAPTLRWVATPWDWSQTRGTLSLGQSGHRFSPYRTDQLQAWLAVETHPWPWNGTRATPIGTLDLIPAASTSETDRP